MALIRVECAACQSALQVRAEMAGQQLKCPKCGTGIVIPTSAEPSAPQATEETPTPAPVASAAPSPAPASTATAPSSSGTLTLAQATAQDLMAEISRRKKSAVLVVFETPADRMYDLNRRPEANVRCFRTPEMTDAQLYEVLQQLGQMSAGQRTGKGPLGMQAGGPQLPYELKGDRLGMTLDDFKTKYARQVGTVKMPYCSDSCPGQANQSLWAEPWHVAAGLVNGRIELPAENNPPTIAGVKTELMLYHFVDGKLFRITAHFDTEAFHLIHNALVQKQGPPTREIKEPMELCWTNGVSTIKLTRGTMRPKRSSQLLFIHNELQKSSEGRAPQRSTDL